MGGGSTTSTTIVKNLPDYAQPYASAMLVRASVLCPEGDPVTQYTDPLFASQVTNETDGITALVTRGRNRNLTIDKGIAFLVDVLDGVYLAGTDDFFQAVLALFHDNFADSVDNVVVPYLGGSVFQMGDLEHANLAKDLCAGTTSKYSGRGQARLYLENYKVSRTDQHNALQYGIEYGAQSYRDAEAIRAAGLYQREYAQAKIESEYNYWVDGQVWRVKKLEILGNAIRALVGSQITKVEPYYKPSPVMGIVGGAISGGMAGYMIAGAAAGPTGIAIGAVAGAALGMLSSR